MLDAHLRELNYAIDLLRRLHVEATGVRVKLNRIPVAKDEHEAADLRLSAEAQLRSILDQASEQLDELARLALLLGSLDGRQWEQAGDLAADSGCGAVVELLLDADDSRDVHRAIGVYQRRNRWADGSGTMVPDGDSNLAGAILGEICRDWLEARGELPQDANDQGAG